jgi:hypothetical protein
MAEENGVGVDPPEVKSGRRVVSSFRDGAVVFRQMWVRCGKRTCTKCPHGPYWYAAVVKRGKWREIYIGKRLVPKPGAFAGGLNEKLRKLMEQEDLLAEAGVEI